MADTVTTTLGLTKPEVGASEDSWGEKINTNFDLVDDALDGTTAVSLDINGGTIDGSVIGGATPAAGTFTTLTANTSIGGTLSTAAQPNVTSVGSLTSLDVTGTVTADGLTVDATVPTVRLDSPATVWAGGEDLGGVDWYTEDTSGSGPAVMARIYSESSGANTLPIPNMIFQTSLADVALKDRMQIAGNGDISFYEDTGTTPKFFWDASSESLGIGTTSPSRNLHVQSTSSNPVIAITSSTTGSVYLGLGDTDSSLVAYIRQDNASGNMTLQAETNMLFSANSAERMRIDSSGNVGIGTSSPATAYKNALQVHGADGGGNIRITNDTTGTGTANGFEAVVVGIDAYLIQREAAPLIFYTNNSEAMRIDSSGNLLVGKTSYGSVTGAGSQLGAGGVAIFTASSDAPLYLNRTASDGTIIDMRKDGTTVGSISSRGGVATNLILRTATGQGAGIGGANSGVLPCDEDGLQDDEINLGASGTRWKDLYLSGGVYLGGTGSANKLDDYETGTWTPTLVGSGGNPTVTYTVREGLYTKIGNIVYINVRIGVSAFSGGIDRILISGLPFTVSSSPSVYSSLSAGLTSNIDFGTGYTQLAPIFDVGTTNINMLGLQSNASYRDLTVSNFSSSSSLSFAGFYRI